MLFPFYGYESAFRTAGADFMPSILLLQTNNFHSTVMGPLLGLRGRLLCPIFCFYSHVFSILRLCQSPVFLLSNHVSTKFFNWKLLFYSLRGIFYAIVIASSNKKEQNNTEINKRSLTKLTNLLKRSKPLESLFNNYLRTIQRQNKMNTAHTELV